MIEEYRRLRVEYETTRLREAELRKEYEALSLRAWEMQAEIDRLHEVQKCAAAVVQLATVRGAAARWESLFVDALNRLALIVPGTRNFEQDPIR